MNVQKNSVEHQVRVMTLKLQRMMAKKYKQTVRCVPTEGFQRYDREAKKWVKIGI